MSRVDRNKLNNIKQKIQKASMGYQAQIWDNGIFEINQIKETDIYLIESYLRRIQEVYGVSSTYRYDYSRPYFGVADKIFTIRGNFDVPYEQSDYNE